MLVLPQSEFGLDVIAYVGRLRYTQHQSVPEIHQALRQHGVPIALRSVTHLVHRYEELVTLCVTDRLRLQERLQRQPGVILAIDGLQPDAGHEILWVVRDLLSGEILRARSLLSATGKELAQLLRGVKEQLPVPVRGVISDGQPVIRNAVAEVFPEVPHQLCQFHYLREAAKPIVEADRHAKKELKKQVRGLRPIERELAGRTDEEAEGIRRYCLAVRSALTDDGHPPLRLPGLNLHDRLAAIHTSIEGVAGKKGIAQRTGAPRHAPKTRAFRPVRTVDAAAHGARVGVPSRPDSRGRGAPRRRRAAPRLPELVGDDGGAEAKRGEVGAGNRPFREGHAQLLEWLVSLLRGGRVAPHE
jgi:hypothetical protein